MTECLVLVKFRQIMGNRMLDNEVLEIKNL